MLTYPGFDPVALALGPLKVRWYGLMYVIGFLAAWWLARRRASEPMSTWKLLEVDDLVFYAVFGVILGGRIGWLLFYGQQALAEDPHYWSKIWLGGMSFHGGLIGVLTALVVLALRHKRAIGDIFDFTAPIPLIGLFTGRVGNFINGELWGKPTTVPWGFAVQDPAGVTQVLHPSQLYEACLEGLLLFAILWIYSMKPRPRWAVSGVFLLGYGLCRVAVEFVRLPDVQLGYLAGGWLTMGMLLSAPMLLIGIGMIVFAYQRPRRSGNYRYEPIGSLESV